MVRIDFVKKRCILTSVDKAVTTQTSEGETTENRQYYNESVIVDWVLNAKVILYQVKTPRSYSCSLITAH